MKVLQRLGCGDNPTGRLLPQAIRRAGGPYRPLATVGRTTAPMCHGVIRSRRTQAVPFSTSKERTTDLCDSPNNSADNSHKPPANGHYTAAQQPTPPPLLSPSPPLPPAAGAPLSSMGVPISLKKKGGGGEGPGSYRGRITSPADVRVSYART
jgi:hypothetical protein